MTMALLMQVMVALVAQAFSAVRVEMAAVPLLRVSERQQRMEAMPDKAGTALTQVVSVVMVATHSSMEMHLVLQSGAMGQVVVMAQMLALMVVRRVLRPLLAAERLRMGQLVRLEPQPTRVR